MNIIKKRLNKFLVGINILNFVFSQYKKFQQLFITQIFSIITFNQLLCTFIILSDFLYSCVYNIIKYLPLKNRIF
jgi:hypothetical protein